MPEVISQKSCTPQATQTPFASSSFSSLLLPVASSSLLLPDLQRAARKASVAESIPSHPRACQRWRGKRRLNQRPCSTGLQSIPAAQRPLSEMPTASLVEAAPVPVGLRAKNQPPPPSQLAVLSPRGAWCCFSHPTTRSAVVGGPPPVAVATLRCSCRHHERSRRCLLRNAAEIPSSRTASAPARSGHSWQSKAVRPQRLCGG